MSLQSVLYDFMYILNKWSPIHYADDNTRLATGVTQTDACSWGFQKGHWGNHWLVWWTSHAGISLYMHTSKNEDVESEYGNVKV